MQLLRAIHPGIAAGYVAAYVLLDWVSFVYPVGAYGITPWSPAAGLSLALLLAFGLQYAPALLAAVALAEFTLRGGSGEPLFVAALAAVLALGYSGLAAALRLLRFDPRLASLRDLAVLVGTVAAGTALVSACYVAVHVAYGLIPLERFAGPFVRSWVGDLIGILVTTPVLLLAVRLRREELRRWRPSFEALLPAAALAAVLAVLLGVAERDAARYVYLLFLPLIWISVRAGVAGAAPALVAVQIGLIIGARSAGFAASTVLEMQLFMLVLAVGTLFLGMAVSERARIQSELLAREVELRDKQLDLERALRHAAASELASALAHELNQPLSAIASYLRACELMLEDSQANRARLAETMGRAVAETRRASEVVKGLREYFRTGTAQLERAEVRPLIEHALEGLRASLQRHEVSLSIMCAPQMPRVHVDRVQIETVLQNLAGNAIDAMAANGPADRRLAVEAERDGADAVRVTVRDSGPGLEPGEAEQVFLPFHSTKPHGMGLGLALSRSIVESHGGRLWSEARPGGATFCFTIPVADRHGGAR